MINSAPQITGDLRRSLADLDEIHAALAHEVKRATPWRGRLRRDALVASIVASTSIEGYQVTNAEAQSLVSGTAPGANDSDSQWAVACYARAMEHVHVMSDDPMFEWNHRVVLDLHFDTCQFQRSKSPGRYRTGAVHVTGDDGAIVYTAPESALVPHLMSEMLTWMNEAEDVHVVVRAAMAHLHFVSIHPFRDGNGRVGRILQSLALGRSAILAPEFSSIEPHLAAHTQEYYEALQSAHGPTYDPTLSAANWVQFCVDAHLTLARDAERRIHALARYWNRVEAITDARGWPDRMVIAINLAVYDMLTRSAYLAEADTTVTTAASDIRRLVDAGLVRQVGAGPTTSYVATNELRQLLADE